MKLQARFDVRFYETDRAARLTPVALFNYLQEAAIRHGDAVGLNGPELERQGYVWMMNRLHFAIERNPTRREVITVETWGSRFKGMFATREWRVTDEAGGTVAVASGRWVMLGGEPKRIIRIPPVVSERYGEYPERALDDPFDRMTAPETPEFERQFHVRFSELDTNQHANSASYVDWCLEAVPLPVLDSCLPHSFEITFKKECRLGEELAARSEELPPGEDGSRRFRHGLWRVSDEALLAIAASTWRDAQ
jgi:medium-chain acyl-[acyl-carrier-protein] hydrolase